MALTDDDFVRIEGSMERTVERVVNRAVEGAMDRVVDRRGLATKEDLDRMETRLLASMSLLERDSFERLDDHERRIRKLEQARAK